MPASIVYSPRAIGDLEDIRAFLAVDCGNPRAAERAVQDILDRVDSLADLPEIGTPLDSRCIVHSDYRFVLSSNYLAFYRYENDSVFIDRVLDSRSDYLRKLFGTGESGIDLYL